MTRPKYISILATAALLTASAFSLTSCGSSGSAQLRALHASPDAPNVDISVNGTSVAKNVPYETATSYLKIKDGKTEVQVYPTGTTTSVLDYTFTATNKSYYTFLAANKVASIQPLLFTDNNSAPPSGDFNLRLIHGAPSAGNVDIYVTAPGAPLGTPTLSNVAFAASSGYMSEPAGSYEVRITPTGTQTVVIDTGALTFAAGQVRTAVALDPVNETGPFQAVVLDDLN